MKKNAKIIAVALVVLVLFGGLVFYRINERKKEQEALKNIKPPATSVSVITAKNGSIAETFSTTGTIVSQSEVNITPKVSGRLLSLNIEEGTYVNAGQVIGQIEHTEVDAQIAQARAQASIAQSNLELLQNGPLNTQIAQASAAVSQAQSMVAQGEVGVRQAEAGLAQAKVNSRHAESEYNRYKSLVDQGAIPAQQLATYKTQMDASKEQVRVAEQQVASAKQQVNTYKQQVASARASLQQLKDGNRPEQISGGRGQIDQANASIKLLEAQLANYTITAPISGLITKKSAEIGSMVSMSNPIATVSKSSNPDLEMFIPEKQILKVKLGQVVNIESSSFPGKTIKVTIREISPVVDLQTRLLKVKGSIASDLPLKIGMSFDCKIVLNESNNSIILPAEAVLSQDDKKIVYVAVNNKVQEKVITIGLQTPSQVQVKSGLAANDQVITKGNTFVKPGDNIQIQKEILVTEG